jgi:choline dehydrogenase
MGEKRQGVARVRSNQARLTAELKSQYDFIVCGSGSSGSVVARRLAENPEKSLARCSAERPEETRVFACEPCAA